MALRRLVGRRGEGVIHHLGGVRSVLPATATTPPLHGCYGNGGVFSTLLLGLRRRMSASPAGAGPPAAAAGARDIPHVNGPLQKGTPLDHEGVTIVRFRDESWVVKAHALVTTLLFGSMVWLTYRLVYTHHEWDKSRDALMHRIADLKEERATKMREVNPSFIYLIYIHNTLLVLFSQYYHFFPGNANSNFGLILASSKFLLFLSVEKIK